MNKDKMKRMKSICMAICTGIGTIQLIYAVAWAVCNGRNIQDFYDTALYIENAVTMSGDGWHLLGYSAILRVFLGMQGVMGDYYVIPLYLMQSAVSLLCYAYGFQVVYKLMFGQKISYGKALIPAAYILTIPIVWQMQFAVLPDALCVAVTVLLFAKLAVCMWENRVYWDCMLVVLGCLLFTGLMHRHYFYGGLLICLFVCSIVTARCICKKYRCKDAFILAGTLAVCIVITSLVCWSANGKDIKGDVYVQYSLEADLWDSCIYPNLREDYVYYSENITEVLPKEVVDLYGNNYEEYMIYIAPVIETTAPENARMIYRQMIEIGLSLHGKEMIKGFAKEGVCHAFIPVLMAKFMYFNGNSLYGHNLVKMYEMAPKLTVDYMHIGMNGFAVVSVLGMIMYAVNLMVQKPKRAKMIEVFIYCALCVVCMLLPAMIFTVLRFDYRLSLFTAFIWAVMAISNIGGLQKK